MGFTDKLLGLLRLNDDDYDDDSEDDNDYYDDEDEYEDIPTPKNASKRNRVSDRQDAAAPADTDTTAAGRRPSVKKSSARGKRSKVVSMQGGTANNMEVCVIKPKNIEDAKEITDTLLNGKAIVLNLEGLSINTAQRIIDFSAGSCCTIDGNLQKIADSFFLVTPSNVDISGDIQDLLESGFDLNMISNVRKPLY